MHRESVESPGIIGHTRCPFHDEGDPRIEENRPDSRELFHPGNLNKEGVVLRERRIQAIIVAKIEIALVT
jgi:hypothetical protein